MGHVESLKMMKEQLTSCVQGQLGDLSKVDTHELGEAIDMIKDLEEAIYYCTITESMEKSNEKGQGDTNITYYTTPYYPDNYNRMPAEEYRYYSTGTGGGGGGRSSGGSGGNGGGQSSSSSSGSSGGGGRGGTSYYTEIPEIMGRDPREGRSPMRRRMYMEGKETQNDPDSQLRELEAYLQELSSDITEMVKDASSEEKATLRQKMTMLAEKIK